MLQIYMLCTICGEPLSQTAQSFMPELMYGVNRSLVKVSVIHSLISKDLSNLIYRMIILELVFVLSWISFYIGRSSFFLKGSYKQWYYVLLTNSYCSRFSPYIVIYIQKFPEFIVSWQARSLLRSLLTIGAVLGLLFGIVGTSVPWLFPYIFTPDQMVIQEVSSWIIKL
jgi:hypothetical protein